MRAPGLREMLVSVMYPMCGATSKMPLSAEGTSWPRVQSTVLRWSASKVSVYSIDTGEAPMLDMSSPCVLDAMRTWRPSKSDSSTPGVLHMV